jgi:hypothetical protein
MFRTMQQRPKALSLCVCMGDYNNKTSMIVCCCSDVCNKDLMTGTMQTAQWGQACIPVNSSEIHGTTRGARDQAELSIVTTTTSLVFVTIVITFFTSFVLYKTCGLHHQEIIRYHGMWRGITHVLWLEQRSGEVEHKFPLTEITTQQKLMSTTATHLCTWLITNHQFITLDH